MNSLLKVVQCVQGTYCSHLWAASRHHFSTSKQQSNSPPPPENPPSPSANEKLQGASPSDHSPDSPKPPKQQERKKTLNLSPEAQRAVWASKVIKQVCEATPPVNMLTSLRKSIIGTKIDTKDYEFTLDSQYREQIISMLTTGIQIDQIVFKQNRILQAKYVGSDNVARLIFYPTTTVSKLVFHRLLSHKNCYFLGSFGIGKTISMVFFIYLAKHINKLMYLSLADWVPKDQRDKFKAQYQLLNKYELLVNAPKCWYWSIHPQLKDSQKSMMELIQLQTQEMCLNKQLKKKLTKFKTFSGLTQFFLELRSHCKGQNQDQGQGKDQNKHLIRQIHHVMIFDQANVLISFLRKWNSSIDHYNLMIRKKQVAQANNFKKKARIEYQKPSLITKGFMQKTENLRNYFILNSSILVQQSLLQKNLFQDHSEKLELQLINHGGPSRQTIQFNKKMEDHCTKMEYSQLLLELIQEKCKTMGVLHKNMTQIGSVFTPLTIKVEKYHRFLFIRQYLNLNQDGFPQDSDDTTIIRRKEKIKKIEQIFLPLIRQQKNSEQIKRLLTELNDDYHEFCMLRCQVIITSYINKGKDKNQAILRRLIVHQVRNKAKLLLALNKKEQNNQQDIQLSMNIKELQQKIQSYVLRPVNKIVKTFFEGNDYKQIIPCKVEGGIIKFQWTVKDFLSISEAVDEFQVHEKDLQLSCMQQPTRKLLLQVPTSKGSYGELLIRNIIRQSKNVFFQIYSTKKKQSQIKIQRQQSFQMHPYSGFFWAFNDNLRNQKVTLRKDLNDLITKAKEVPNKNILGTPQYISKDAKTKQPKLVYAHNNKGVDFIIVKYSSQKKIFQITTFDVTIDIDNIKQKAVESLQMLKILLETGYDPNDMNMYYVRHIILCPQQGCRRSRHSIRKLSDEQCQVKIGCFPIEGFRYDSQETIYTKRFKTWKWMTQLQQAKELNDHYD